MAHPSTERSVLDDFSSRDSYADDSYQEIFPVPLLDYLSENSDQQNGPLSNPPNHLHENPPDSLHDNLPNNLHVDLHDNPLPNLSANRSNGQAGPDEANLHALPSIELSDQFPYKRSFVILHSPSQNQYLNLARLNPGDQEKRFILTELNGPLSSKLRRPNERTSVTIVHPSSGLSNINLSLSFSQPTSTISTSTALPKLNTTTTGGGANLTSLSAVSAIPVNGSDPSPPAKPANFSSLTLNAANQSATLITNKTSSSLTIELVSTNIEKPKELAANSLKESGAKNQSSLPDEIDVNRTLTSEELLDNNSTQASYAALADDVLKLDVNDSTFNKINSTGLDLIYDALNDTITDDGSLNSTRTG